MSEIRYFTRTNYHWRVPHPEVDYIIQQHHTLTPQQDYWCTIAISIHSFVTTIDRQDRRSLRIRLRVYTSEFHPANNIFVTQRPHSVFFEPGESREVEYVLRRIFESVQDLYFWGPSQEDYPPTNILGLLDLSDSGSE